MSGPTKRRVASLAWLGLTVVLATAPPGAAGINDGLLAEYRFEGNTVDSTGNGNDGTPSGGPTYTAGHAGQAISLDGIDDVVVLPATFWTSDFTTAFWVRTTASAPLGSFWYEGDGMVDGEVCGSPVGGDFGIAMINGGHVMTYDTQTTLQVNDGTFHSVIVTRSTVDDSVKTYVDGQLDAAYQIQPGGFTGISWIGVGNNPCDSSFGRRFFAGDIDELRFYDRVIVAEEIAELSGGGSVDAPLASAGVALSASVFPNPTRGRATLTLALPWASDARLEVYDLRGARVRTLADRPWAAGSHSVEWRGDDERGRAVGPGVYFVVFRAGAAEVHRKLVVVE